MQALARIPWPRAGQPHPARVPGLPVHPPPLHGLVCLNCGILHHQHRGFKVGAVGCDGAAFGCGDVVCERAALQLESGARARVDCSTIAALAAAVADLDPRQHCGQPHARQKLHLRREGRVRVGRLREETLDLRERERLVPHANAPDASLEAYGVFRTKRAIVAPVGYELSWKTLWGCLLIPLLQPPSGVEPDAWCNLEVVGPITILHPPRQVSQQHPLVRSQPVTAPADGNILTGDSEGEGHALGSLCGSIPVQRDRLRTMHDRDLSPHSDWEHVSAVQKPRSARVGLDPEALVSDAPRCSL
eukprot:3155511-Rhodomonas_salina.2